MAEALQATAERSSLEEVLCSKTIMKIIKTLKKYGRLKTNEIADKVSSSFTLKASHLTLLENQGILVHAGFGVRSHIYRFNGSRRARAILKLLEAWE
jgi:predicted transcriptional regulator